MTVLTHLSLEELGINVPHFDMSSQQNLGLNFTIIPKTLIPYFEDIEDGDIIENLNKYKLMYQKNFKGYFLVTSDFTDFLPNNERFSKWIKA